MANKNYQKGYRFEKRVEEVLAKLGFVVVSSRGSHSLVDIVAVGNAYTLLIQCKTDKGALKREDWNELLKMTMERSNIFPVFAWRDSKNKIHFWKIKCARLPHERVRDGLHYIPVNECEMSVANHGLYRPHIKERTIS